MSKLLLPVLCLCLAAWLFGGSIWFGNQYSKSDEQTSWEVQDGQIQFSSPTTFSFQESDAEIILDENQHAMIAQISEYLIANPDRHLYLKGLYSETEMKNETYDNMGLARAESFRYLIYRQGVHLHQLHTSALKVKKHQLNNNGLIHGGVDFYFSESPLAKYDPALSFKKFIRFESNSSIISKDQDFDDYLPALRQYLVDHPDKKVEIIGIFSKKQTKKITQKRVDYLKHKLSQAAIPDQKVSDRIYESEPNDVVKEEIEVRIL